MNLTKFGWRHAAASLFPPTHVLRGVRVHKLVEASVKSSDSLILSTIEKGTPSLVGRFGGTEARVLGCYLDLFKGYSISDPISTTYSLLTVQKRLKQLESGAGVYPPNWQTLRDFANEYLFSIRNSDLIGCWGETFTWVEDFALKESKARCVSHHATTPWVESIFNNNPGIIPWSAALKDKKVLIVSSFSKSFEKQFFRINNVFPNSNFHAFTPIFLDSPRTQGGLNDGSTWKVRLDEMKQRMSSIDFDIALVSAGGYSYPLANHAKTMGKIGVHTGGELQLFFGVKGRRWENSVKVNKYENSFWIRPSEEEKPRNWLEIENGCYW